MSNRIDELFTLNRLRRQWRRDLDRQTGAPAQKIEPLYPDHVGSELRTIRALLEKRYVGGTPKAVGILLDAIDTWMAGRYRRDEPVDGAAAHGVYTDEDILTLFNQLEDLIEALDLGKEAIHGQSS